MSAWLERLWPWRAAARLREAEYQLLHLRADRNELVGLLRQIEWRLTMVAPLAPDVEIAYRLVYRACVQRGGVDPTSATVWRAARTGLTTPVAVRN